MKRQQMIGLYTQNKNIQEELLHLLKDIPIESYQPDHTYHVVIWLSEECPPKNLPVLLANELSLPLTVDEWHLFLKKYTLPAPPYHNNFFTLETDKRLLTDLKTKKTISLTEKETELFTFLIHAPTHAANRETLLQAVWHYNPEAQTHTLESHLYALKQKIGKRAEHLIQYQNGIVKLL